MAVEIEQTNQEKHREQSCQASEHGIGNAANSTMECGKQVQQATPNITPETKLITN
jgi:hypothetical protein